MKSNKVFGLLLVVLALAGMGSGYFALHLEEEGGTMTYQSDGWVRSVWVYSHDQVSHSVISFDKGDGSEIQKFYVTNIEPRVWAGMHTKISLVADKRSRGALNYIEGPWCIWADERLWNVESVSQIQ